MEKKMFDMNNKELFGVLTSRHGAMAQFDRRKVIMTYRQRHDGNKASLEEMVRDYGLQETA